MTARQAWRSDAPVVRERITMALDIQQLFGPEVDRALGVEEPTVDRWESGEEVPAAAQVAAIALLTGFPVRFFYKPMEAMVMDGWLCGADGCVPLIDKGPVKHCETCACSSGTTR